MRTRTLKKLYIVAMLFLAALILLTPYLVNKSDLIFEEEIMETTVIALIFVIAFLVNNYYENQMRKIEDHLKEAWKHIGKMNLLTQSFKKALLPINKVPENKGEVKKLLIKLSQDILTMTNCPFVELRIVHLDTMKVLSQHLQARGADTDITIKIANKKLIAGDDLPDHTAVESFLKNAKIKAFCILPKTSLNEEQEVFIKKIATDLVMFYMIYNSRFYNK